MSRLIVVCSALLICEGLACQRRYLSNIIVTHLDDERPHVCQEEGQHCKYDRNCCARMECKMTVDVSGITSRCQYRIVYEDYKEQSVGPTWKDYQEMESSEEDELKVMNLGDLERRNVELRTKLAELNMLKKSVSRKQLVDTKQMLEEAEIEELKKARLNYEKDINSKIERLKKTELQNELETLEKKEVNKILSKQQRVANLYKDMLYQLTKKEK